MVELVDAARVGFAGLDVAPSTQEAALSHLKRWLEEPIFSAYRAQLQTLIEQERWELLLDCFYQVLPFGTGGRRGPVGIGPNRFNPWTLAASVQGHASYLRNTLGDGPLVVVMAYDVRCFKDLRGHLAPGIASPVDGMTSRAFAEIAAEVYAAHEISVWLPPEGTYTSTPELSFSIRHLEASGGLNISASHNFPDDNGGKFYNKTGSQEVPPKDEEMAKLVESVAHVERMPIDRARAAGLIREIAPEVHQAYIDTNLACGLLPDARSAKVVFTGLHGTGRTTVFEVLDQAGFEITLEPTQAEFDGAFENVPFRVPNPEVQRTMEAACAHADRVGGDLVMACDPDADRLGLMVRHPLNASSGNWRFFTGNEIACLTALCALEHGGIASPILMRTEVTSKLFSRLALARGGRVVDDLLVGFKYIGDALDRLETHGSFRGVDGSLDDFAVGAEESHGVLVTSEVRDKDAAGAALLLSELASIEKDAGRTLVDTLRGLWREVGYFRNELRSTIMLGAEGRTRIQRIQEMLRQNPPSSIGGFEVTAFHDRKDPAGPFGAILSGTDEASRDVLVFELGDRARLILRPSGTEPKNKIYVEVAGEPGADLSEVIPGVNRQARALGDAFLGMMLTMVDIDLPPWALKISDLVPVEAKVRFAHETVAELLRAQDNPEEMREVFQRAMKPFGKDGASLFSEAIRACPQATPGVVALFE